MAELDIININQSLHGYKAGHKLLSCSVELSETEKRFMLALSDYSGSGKERGFESYLTGYPLPSSKFYVFAKTWYADEMNRPGCVWTHSLLINFTDLWAIKDMAILESLFTRPTISSDYSEYSQRLSVKNGTEILNKNIPLFFELSCELYSNYSKGIVLLGEDSDQYKTQILQIWNWQWPRMKRNFTFSTGSMSVRVFEKGSFDIQVVPFKRQRLLPILEKENYKISYPNSVACNSEWLEDYKEINLEELKQFMVKFGSDVMGERKNFVPLLVAFQILNSKKDFELEAIENFFGTNFSDPTSAKQLKISIVDALYKSQKKNRYRILEFILSNTTFSNIKWEFSKLILDLWETSQLSVDQLQNLIAKLIDEGFEEDVISILVKIKPSELIALDLDSIYYQKILELSPHLETEISFWNSDRDIQDKWYKILEKNPKTDWSNVVYAMLQANSVWYVDEMYKRLGSGIIDIMVNWISSTKNSLPIAWQPIIRTNQEVYFNSLCKVDKMNKELIQLALEIFSPYDRYWKNIPTTSIEIFLNSLGKEKFEIEITGMYTFFITACYDNNLADPVLINTIVFQPLHDKLKKDINEPNSWERFKWYMGNDLYRVIEQNFFSKLFNDKSKVPDWDRCEFLRRSLVVSFLKYEWDPIGIVEAVDDQDTFKNISDFSYQIHEGSTMLKKIYKRLKSSKNQSTFHYKLLKRLFE